jgi:hypothetical protein
LIDNPEDQEPLHVPENSLHAAGDSDVKDRLDWKPMNFQEMEGKSESGKSLDVNMDSEEQEIEVAEPITVVTESCSEIQENGSMEEAGPSVVDKDLIPGNIELDPWENSLDVGGQDVPEKQTCLESRDLLFSGQRDENGQEFPEPQAREDLEAAENCADPKHVNLEQIEAAGSNSNSEFSAESGNEEIENPKTVDCLPGPSRSSKRKKSKEIRSNGSTSENIQKRRKLARKCKILNYCELTDASEPKSMKTSGPPSNGKPKKNPGTTKFLKNQKPASGTRELANAENEKKNWRCVKCGLKFGYKCHLNRHRETHNTTRDYACQFCNKAFKTSASRYAHEKIHTARKVKCVICGKECKNLFALKNHLRYTHSNHGKPACGICHKILSSKKYLRRHERSVHKLNLEK